MDPIERFRMLRSEERWTPTQHVFTPTPRLAAADAPRRWWAWAVPAVVVAAALAVLAAFTLGGVFTLGKGSGPAAPSAPATSVAGVAAVCQESSIRADFALDKDVGGGANTAHQPIGVYYYLTVTNDGDAACTLPDLPSLNWNQANLLGPSHATLTDASRDAVALVIEPGHSLYSLLTTAVEPLCDGVAHPASIDVYWAGVVGGQKIGYSVKTPSHGVGCPFAKVGDAFTATPYTATLPIATAVTSSPMPTTQPTGASGVALCAPGHLQGTADVGGPAGGAWYMTIRLTNPRDGGGTCQLPGLPTLQWMSDDDRTRLGAPVKAGPYVTGGDRSYVVKPGQSVYLSVELQPAVDSCAPVSPAALRITFPGVAGASFVWGPVAKACADGSNLIGLQQIGTSPAGNDASAAAKPPASEIQPCDGGLLVPEGASGGSATVSAQIVRLSNFGPQWCKLSGFPSLELTDGVKNYGSPATPDDRAGVGGTVDLKPGGSAYFAILFHYRPSSKNTPESCINMSRHSGGYLVTLPHLYGTVYVDGGGNGAACMFDSGTTLSVTPYASTNPSAKLGG